MPHSTGALRAAAAAPIGPAGERAAAAPSPMSGEIVVANSSPVPEIGGVIATLTLGSEPYGAAYDPDNGYVYITNFNSRNVSVLSGTRVIASVNVGRSPSGGIYDPKNGYVYIPNSASNNVSVINGTKLFGTITDAGFNTPYGGAYDPVNGLVYLANEGASTVMTLNGVKVASTITVGLHPMEAAFNPVNSYMYVTNEGANSVSIISGTTVVTTVTGSFANPSGVAYDPLSGVMYVANRDVAHTAQSYMTIIANESVVATFRAGHDAYGVVFDSGNGYMYVESSDNDLGGFQYPVDNITAVNGTSLVGNITVGSNGYFMAYDTQNYCLYVASAGNLFFTTTGSLAIVCTTLSEGPITAAPLGNPIGSADVGQPVHLNSTLFAAGVAPDTSWAAENPNAGFHCGAPLMEAFGVNSANLTTTCNPTLPGNYTIWMNVTDGLGKTVWTSIEWQIFPHPNASAPVAWWPGQGVLTSADGGQFVNISVTVGVGSGLVGDLHWSGLPVGTCDFDTSLPLNTNMTCRFGEAANLTIWVTLNDTNGEMAASPPLHFQVYAHLDAQAPLSSSPSADVNESTVFSANVLGGTGSITSYVWQGLGNGTCSGLSTSKVTCTFAAVGVETVSVMVTDTNGISSQSPPLIFAIDPELRGGTPIANRTSVDVGQAVAFTIASSGGSGRYSYTWTGLPSDCVATGTPTPTCVMQDAGTVSARAITLDSNGVRVGPSVAVNVTVYADPVVGVIIVAPNTVALGGSVTIAAAVAGGAGNDDYTWLGLPPGCATVRASQFSCHPTQTGSFHVAVNVVDGNGFVTLGNESNLTVTPAVVTSSVGGLSDATLFEVIAIVAVAAAVVELLLILRKRK
jgi:YVTN family beta-propeller protein